VPYKVSIKLNDKLVRAYKDGYVVDFAPHNGVEISTIYQQSSLKPCTKNYVFIAEIGGNRKYEY